MAWSLFTTKQIDAVSRQGFMPLILLVSYTLLLYLMTFHWARRRERRVVLLFIVAAIGVVCLIPFANPDDDTVGHLNDVSESCCVITFLLQITVIGYDLNRKMKFKTVLVLTYIAELLIIADILMMLLSLIVVFKRDFLTQSLQEDLPNMCENVTLAYIFLFRYYYIVASRGWRDLWTHRKVEICWYLLFATHEVPFVVLANSSGFSWEAPQALWNRVTLAGCLWVTARTKLRKDSSNNSTNSPSKHHSTVTQTRTVDRSGITERGPKKYVIAVAASPPRPDDGTPE